jgi:putative transcriptional regulator
MQIPNNQVPEHKLSNNLLIADPSLLDGCFNRSVIFMLEHAPDQGSTGLILNHPTGKSVGQLISSDAFSKLAHLPVCHGGPVDSDQLHFAVFEWNNNALHCHTRISAEQAVEAMQQRGKLVRAFAGHSDWTSGQLHEELEMHSWITAYSRQDTLSHLVGDDFWAKSLQEISSFHHILSLTPENPFLN